MTPVIGRQAEVEALEAFLTRTPCEFACLVLEGEAGIGKTTLWQTGVEFAIDQSSTVLSCRPSQAERELPFSALGDLLDRVDVQVLERLPGPQRRALEVALLREDAGARPPDQRAVAVALLSLLRELGKSGLVVVAVDDAQWIDPPTADALRYVARRLVTESVAMLVAARAGDGPALTFDRAVPEARRQAIRLQGLALHGLHEVLRVRLKHVFPRPTLLKIAEASHGNPFYALEIGREVMRAGRRQPGAPLPAPADLRELVTARVRTLPAPTRATLLAASAMPYVTMRVLNVDACSLQPAVEAEIVRVAGDGRISFVHPLYASAIYESEPMSTRRELHRRLAELAVVQADERARHLALASSPPDEEVARALERGAARARQRGAWQFAAELLEHARAFTRRDRPHVAARRGIAAAEHHAHAGDRKRASALLEELLGDELDATLRAEGLCLLGQIRYNDESFAESLRLFEKARQYASSALSIANIELDLAYAASHVWDFERSATHVARALELTHTLEEDGLHAMALAYHAMSGFLQGNGINWHTVEQAVALEDPDRTVPLQRTPGGVLGLLLFFDGHLVEARHRLELVCQRAIERGDESDTAYFLCWLAWLETEAGDLGAAQARANQALLVATLTESTSIRAFALACRAMVHTLQGDIALARRDCDDASCLAEQTANGIAARMIASVHCLLELSVGDASAAWQAAEPLLAQLGHVRGAWEPRALLFLPDALDALITMGQLDRAEALLDAFQDRARALERSWAVAMGERCRGLLLAARGDLPGATVHLERAVHEHRRLGMPFELARTLLCVGQVERRRKLRKSARTALAEALEIFEKIGTPLWATRARSELERTHLREAPAELTPSELGVAELAGSGLSNRQIATRLFLSPKTVEANLARAYGKLGIRSRAELGARMARGVVHRDE
ncbi:MAG TPA: AAA family ATPase [Chloroflexota bacterium]